MKEPLDLKNLTVLLEFEINKEPLYFKNLKIPLEYYGTVHEWTVKIEKFNHYIVILNFKYYSTPS